MSDQTLATSSTLEEERTLGRRELLKALTAGGGAIAASAMLSGQWVKPVVEVGVLPAHAQSSALTYFQQTWQNLAAGNSEQTAVGTQTLNNYSTIHVTVQGTTAYVKLMYWNGDYAEFTLNTDGTPFKDFTIYYACNGGDDTNDYLYNVENYTYGDAEINIKRVSNSSEVITVPLGTGSIPVIPCNAD